jgi:hypothetical protein
MRNATVIDGNRAPVARPMWQALGVHQPELCPSVGDSSDFGKAL